MKNNSRITNNTSSNNIQRSVLTRKIRLLIDVPNNDKDALKKYYRILYDWQKIAFKASNIITSHLFFQQQVKEIIYFEDDIKMKLVKRYENEPPTFCIITEIEGCSSFNICDCFLKCFNTLY